MSATPGILSYAKILVVPSLPANSITNVFLARAEKGRTEAIEEEVLQMFELMSGRLVGYALSFGISRQDGEDVVQDTFLALFGHLQQGRPRNNLRAWLYRVTHNLALKRRTRITVEPVAPTNEVDRIDPQPNPEEALLFQEKHALFQAALHALPGVDQRCLRLRAEGLRYREIGRILGISLGSVSASLARSFARLERAEGRS